MPSKSLQNFENNLLVDVDRLVDSHAELNHDGMGRRGLGHITRSAILMLCAAWERYVENALIEGAQFLAEMSSSPRELPLVIQQTIAKSVTAKNQHELMCLSLAGTGWKDVYVELVRRETELLNTPKSRQLDEMFGKFLAAVDISTQWSCGKDAFDAFVSLRGEIAHSGREASYVRIGDLEGYRATVLQTAIETDNFLATHLRNLAPTNQQPWRRRGT